MRTFRFVLLASAGLAFASCGRDVTAPDAATPGSPSSLSPFFAGATADTDSVIAGYGCESTGGLDYECFEYDPCTGTEYVVCPDTTTAPPPPPPPPPPAPKPTSPTPTAPTPTTRDSVISGYGSGGTGGIEY